MIIISHGHSEFLLKLESGIDILIDPYPPQMLGYGPEGPIKADIVLSSHKHDDHRYLDKVQGPYTLVEGPGVHRPHPDVTVTGVDSFHDDKQGAERGHNTIMLIETEGLRIVHLGDLGTMLDAAQLNTLIKPSVLLTPVGGKYTISAKVAGDIVRALRPQVTVPMHYRSAYGGFPVITQVDPFIAELSPLTPRRQTMLRVTAGDLSQQPPFVILDPDWWQPPA